MREETYGNIIPPAHPATKSLRYSSPTNPLPPFSLGDPAFKQRSYEQDCREEERTEDIHWINGPPAQETKRIVKRSIAALLENQPDHEQ